MQHPSDSFPSETVLYLEFGVLVVFLLAATLSANFRVRAQTAGHALLARLSGLGRPRWRELLTVALLAVLGHALISGVLGFARSGTSDDVAYLLAGETLASGHLTNPAAPSLALVPEQVLQTPTYVGKYPPGQGALLAVGFLMGQPALALWLAAALLASACLWCFQGWLPRRWALLAGLLVLLRLAVGSYWNHTYWGGSMAAIGGALLYGGLGGRYRAGRVRSVPAMAIGLLVLAFSRPWEGALLALPVLIWLTVWQVRWLLERPAEVPASQLQGAANLSRTSTWPHNRFVSAALLLLIGLAGVAGLAGYNQATTGDPLVFAHQRYEEQRPVAGEFVWQRWINSQQRMSWDDIDIEPSERSGWWRPAILYFFSRMATASVFLIGPVLVLCVLVALVSDRRSLLPVLSILSVCVGHALVHFHFPHYSAPMTAPLFVLGMIGARRLFVSPPGWLRQGGTLVSVMVVLQLVSFVYQLPGLRHDPEEFHVLQLDLMEELDRQGGEHLILVDPKRAGLYNFRDLGAKVIWAHDLGPEATAEVLALYPERELWLFDPYDDEPLQRLEREGATALDGDVPFVGPSGIESRPLPSSSPGADL